jgi:glycosyltransferase involved in cell wall biosynthesis
LGRQAQLLTEGLRGAGVDLFVIARKMRGVSAGLFSPDVEVVRVPAPFPGIHILEEVSFRNIFVSTIFSLGCLATLVLRRKRYDIVHFHGASIPLFVCLPFLRAMGKKTVVKVASSQGTEAGSLAGRYGIAGRLILRIIRKADAYVAISEEIRNGLLRDGVPAGKIHHIPNFVDFETFRPSAREAREEGKAAFGWSGKTVLLYVGRLAPIKGLEHLLDAFRDLSREFPDLLLVLLGEGPSRSSLEEQASRNGISHAVRFLGRVENVPDYVRVADVFVLPSLQEGMPNALLEAMAAGLPAVATRTGGILDLLENGRSGLLADPGNDRELAEGIRTLLATPELRERISRAAYETVRYSFSLESRLERYRDLYATVSASGIERET